MFSFYLFNRFFRIFVPNTKKHKYQDNRIEDGKPYTPTACYPS